MDNDIKPLIESTFADNSFDDFYAYSIILDEGISKLYTAQIKILTIKPHSRPDLKGILKKQVSIRIEQKFDGIISCSRYLQGIVTSPKEKPVGSPQSSATPNTQGSPGGSNSSSSGQSTTDA